MIVAAEDVLRQLLVNGGIGTYPNPAAPTVWPVFVSFVSDEGPDNSIHCLGNQIPTNLTEQRTGAVVEHYSVGVILRSKDFPNGQLKMDALDVLVTRSRKVPLIVSGRPYLLQSAIRKTTVVHMGQEPKNLRELFTGVYILSIKEN